MPGPHVSFKDLSLPSDDFLSDVLAGLRAPRKSIPPKYFYDAVGSALFDAICVLPEYYPTRTEMALTAEYAGEIAAALGPEVALVEFGSGSSRKTQILLAAVRPAVYVPIDISADALRASCERLAGMFPALPIAAVCGDYSRPLALPPLERWAPRRRVIYFPGSTIGNFTPADALAFLEVAAGEAGAGGGLVIGVDLKKDKALLDAAYADPPGVTAAFNLNLLARINRELGADFDLSSFRHSAGYVPERGRVEMHLVSTRDQVVRVGTERIRFAEGETIHTENSYKYEVDEFRALAARAGFEGGQCWVDRDRLFSIHYLVRR